MRSHPMCCRPFVGGGAVVGRFEVRYGNCGRALLVEDGVTVAILYWYDAILVVCRAELMVEHSM
jgi:hypothetical protein